MTSVTIPWASPRDYGVGSKPALSNPNSDRTRVIFLIALGDVVISVDNESDSMTTAGVTERVVKLAIPVQLGGIGWYALVATVSSNLLAIDKPLDVELSSALIP